VIQASIQKLSAGQKGLPVGGIKSILIARLGGLYLMLPKPDHDQVILRESLCRKPRGGLDRNSVGMKEAPAAAALAISATRIQ